VLAGRHGGTGAQAALQQHLRARYSAREVLLTDSGTSALRLALALATGRSGASRLVALPAWSCYDLATAADGAGVEVVLYDLDPLTLGPDWTSFDAALSHKSAAVVVVHPFGIPAPIAEARRRALPTGALIIEDAAQAIGAEPDGKPAGSHGDLAILSFGRGKGWTGGGGGALLSHAEIALPSAESLDASAGSGGVLVKSLIQWGLGRPSLYGVPSSLPFVGLGQTVYHPPHAPRRPTSAMAGILMQTEPLLGSEVAARRRNAARLASAVQASGAGQVPGAGAAQGGWLRLPFLPSDTLRSRLRQGEGRRLGVLPGYPIALARLPGFAERLRHVTPTPGAELLAERLHTIPTHSLLTATDLTRIEAWLRGAA
jgi:dTDP-4-amino-4,6-dideoxygalactose transaminase